MGKSTKRIGLTLVVSLTLAGVGAAALSYAVEPIHEDELDRVHIGSNVDVLNIYGSPAAGRGTIEINQGVVEQQFDGSPEEIELGATAQPITDENAAAATNSTTNTRAEADAPTDQSSGEQGTVSADPTPRNGIDENNRINSQTNVQDPNIPVNSASRYTDGRAGKTSYQLDPQLNDVTSTTPNGNELQIRQNSLIENVTVNDARGTAGRIIGDFSLTNINAESLVIIRIDPPR